MGACSSSSTLTPGAPILEVPSGVPPFFAEILMELLKYKSELGGQRNFEGTPEIRRKIKREDFSKSYTDYEYIYLTVLGFACLHGHSEEMVRKNNGKTFDQNPAVQMLERECGMTMHGDRAGANHILRIAAGIFSDHA